MENKKEPYEVIRARHYANVFKGDSGEFVLQDLLKEGCMFSDGFDPDTSILAYLAGKRSILCYITERLQLNEMEVYAKTKMDSVINNEFKSSLDYEINSQKIDDSDYAQSIFNSIKNESGEEVDNG